MQQSTASEDGETLTTATPWLGEAIDHKLSSDAMATLASQGWVLLHAVSREAFERIAIQLGSPVSSRLGSEEIDILSPSQAGDAPAHSLSATFGTGAFPHHSDAAYMRIPPRWILMRMAEPGPGRRQTCIRDVVGFAVSHRKGLGLLQRAVWYVASRQGSFYIPILGLAPARECPILRWDYRVMRPASPSAQGAASKLHDLLTETPEVAISWQRNDLLILDNWRVLHARGSAAANDAGKRKLERILVCQEVGANDGR
jgi:hypothetical protein